MKKNLFYLLLFIFIPGIYFSQEYHFDYKCYDMETQIKGGYKGSKRTNVVYFNSQNKDFIAYNYSFSKEPTRSFFLYDYKESNFYSYTINNDSKFSSLNFRYKSAIEKYNDEIKIERIEVEKNSENVFLIKAFPSQKSKKTNLELKIKVEKNNFPMIRIRFMDLTPNIHTIIYDALLSNLDSPNYRIIDIVTNYRNGVIMHDDYSKCERINLKLLIN